MKTKTEYIEIFHLLFLSHLEKKLEKNLYALKGGCNLRFFFKSIRYSEDIDFDVQTIARETLINKIDKLLLSPPFKMNLKSKDLEIISFSKPKQTDTTQRWKLLLKGQGLLLDIPTKIEFSRRSIFKDGLIFEPIDSEIIRNYGLYPIIANHYNLLTAFNQKVQALINRTETQSRDVFDLKLLIEQNKEKNNLRISKKDHEMVVQKVNSIRFEDFTSQVVAYLLEDYQSYYNNENVWQGIKEFVINNILISKK